MEKETNKAKLEILKFWENQFYHNAIGYNKIGSNYALPENSIKNMLIMAFLHAEFIFAMKTVQNPTIFMKNQNNRKMNNFGNFC